MPVCVDRAALDAPGFTLLCSGTQFDLPRQILSTMPRASAAFAVEVKLAEKAGLRRRLLLAHSICSIDAAAHNFVAPRKRQESCLEHHTPFLRLEQEVHSSALGQRTRHYRVIFNLPARRECTSMTDRREFVVLERYVCS